MHFCRCLYAIKFPGDDQDCGEAGTIPVCETFTEMTRKHIAKTDRANGEIMALLRTEKNKGASMVLRLSDLSHKKAAH